MREATGSTFIFTLAITFTLIFSGFLVLAIHYNRAYKIKNEVTSMIERYEGLTGTDELNNLGSIGIINKYLLNNGYNAMGNCEDGEYGISDLNQDVINDSISKLVTNTEDQYYYCIKYIPDKKNCKGYFRVTVFFDFNLPVFGKISKFSVKGQTNEMYPVYIGNTKVIGKDVC